MASGSPGHPHVSSRFSAQGMRSRAGRAVDLRWCEALEGRCLLSSVFTAEEVYFSELVNRARSDPQAEGVRLGIDLTDGLTDEEAALLGAVEPLALEWSLTAASRLHSTDMATRAFFDHINPDGLNPTQRAQAAGYSGVAGEVIAAGQNSIDALYASWMDTAENRINLLSLLTSFDASFHYDQIGPGFGIDLGFADDHYTALFGDPGSGSTSRLVGVVYDDADADAFYSIGEGAAGVRVDVASSSNPDKVAATFTTDEAGNYQIVLGDGSWIVTFTEVATGKLVTKQVTTSGENVKVDAVVDELETPPDDGGDGDGGDGGDDGSGDGGDDGSGDGGTEDDHADDGEYGSATLVPLDSDYGGSDSGEVGTGGDTDLFYFTSGIAGELTVTLDGAGGELIGSLTLKSAAGLALIAEDATSGGGAVSVTWNVPEGEQYFLVVGSADEVSLGLYTLAVAIVEPSEDDGSGDGGDGGDGSDGGDGGSGDDGTGDGSGDDGSGGDQGAEDDDPPLDATSDDSGAFTIVRTDENGRPILYLQEDDGSWTRVDLIGEAGGPTPEGRFSTFVDPGTGRSSIVSATGSGLAIYVQDEAGGWSVRNLSVELDAAPIVTNTVTFTTRTGLVYTAGLDAEGNLVTYRHTGDLDDEGGRAWGFDDLSTDHLAVQGLVLPDLIGSTLIAYVTGWNGLTIAGLDAAGNIHAAWWTPGMEKWTLADLSAITGAPEYTGRISAYLTPWNGINIAGTDVNGDLSVVWWVPSFGGEWKVSKLNQLLDGPRLMEGTIASWVTPWGGLNVSGLTAAGDVVVYWWSPSTDGWQITTLSDFIPEVEPPAVGVIGHTSNTGVISIMGLSEAGDLVRYWWQAGESWRGENLSVGA